MRPHDLINAIGIAAIAAINGGPAERDRAQQRLADLALAAAHALEAALAERDLASEAINSARDQLPGFPARAKAILDRAARGKP